MAALSADARLAAVSVAMKRRLRCQRELIARLADPDPRVAQAARLALVRLARGADLGPAAGADRLERLRCLGRWRRWWSLQDDNPKAHKPDEAPEEDDPKKLADALVKAPAARRPALLGRLRDSDEDGVASSKWKARSRVAGPQASTPRRDNPPGSKAYAPATRRSPSRDIPFLGPANPPREGYRPRIRSIRMRAVSGRITRGSGNSPCRNCSRRSRPLIDTW
jgi:hypothetical protein